MPNKAVCCPIVDKYGMVFRKGKNAYTIDATDKIIADLNKANAPYRIEPKRKYKYLEYFDKAADGYAYLAKMNSGEIVREHASMSSMPTFKRVYEQYIDFITSRKKKPSDGILHSYAHGYKLWSDLHDLKFKQITTQQLQNSLSSHSDLSKSSVSRMTAIARKLYKYAMAHDICDEDKSAYLFVEYTETDERMHKPFTRTEIDFLWAHCESTVAQIALILIYTGMRCGEFLKLKPQDIHLDERYLIGGSKTEAGRNRTIPIHKRIVPLFESIQSDGEYLITTRSKAPFTTSNFGSQLWNPYFESIKMPHRTHDGRHTCATMMEAVGIPELHRKLILGHKIADVTTGVYTHVSIEDLIRDIDMLE